MHSRAALASHLRKSFLSKCLCNLIFFNISKRWGMSGKSVAKWDISVWFQSVWCALHVWSIGGYKVFARCPPSSEKVHDNWKMTFKTNLGSSADYSWLLELKVSFSSVWKISKKFLVKHIKSVRLGLTCVERWLLRGLAGHSRGADMACQSCRKDAGGREDRKVLGK